MRLKSDAKMVSSKSKDFLAGAFFTVIQKIHWVFIESKQENQSKWK